MLDIATAEEKEVILLGDFNFDFLPSVSKTDACKRLNLLFKLLNFKQCISIGFNEISLKTFQLCLKSQILINII